MDDSCVVCAESLDWVAYGACGHKDVYSTCVARLRFICNDNRCCICNMESDVVFVTKVMLLGRLHHRNLVNLVGYCAEKHQHILIYVYMSRGSLASHLYGEKLEPLNWELRIQIALDVARGSLRRELLRYLSGWHQVQRWHSVGCRYRREVVGNGMYDAWGSWKIVGFIIKYRIKRV